MTTTIDQAAMAEWKEAPPVMVTASPSGAQIPLDVASRTLILMAERYRKQFGECLRDAMLGE